MKNFMLVLAGLYSLQAFADVQIAPVKGKPGIKVMVNTDGKSIGLLVRSSQYKYGTYESMHGDSYSYGDRNLIPPKGTSFLEVTYLKNGVRNKMLGVVKNTADLTQLFSRDTQLIAKKTIFWDETNPVEYEIKSGTTMDGYSDETVKTYRYFRITKMTAEIAHSDWNEKTGKIESIQETKTFNFN
jgi:hypothetical protein